MYSATGFAQEILYEIEVDAPESSQETPDKPLQLQLDNVSPFGEEYPDHNLSTERKDV